MSGTPGIASTAKRGGAAERTYAPATSGKKGNGRQWQGKLDVTTRWRWAWLGACRSL